MLIRTLATTHRFGHEYHVREGETLLEIAQRFGTTMKALVDLNYNSITHIHNPARLRDGDTLCIVPAWHKTRVSLFPFCSMLLFVYSYVCGVKHAVCMYVFLDPV